MIMWNAQHVNVVNQMLVSVPMNDKHNGIQEAYQNSHEVNPPSNATKK